MRKLLFSWMTFWIVVAGLIVWRLVPLRKNLRFGMDLVGGTFLTLEVDTDKAVENELKSIVQRIPKRLKENNIPQPIKRDVKATGMTLEFADANTANEAFNYVKDNYSADLVPDISGKSVTLKLKQARITMIKSEAALTNTEILRNRLNALEVEDIQVYQKGEKQIIIELPDVANPQTARAMIGKPAILEFKLVEKSGRTKEDILYEFDGVMPDGKEIVPSKERRDGKPVNYYLVSKFTEITGNMLRDAKPGIGGRLVPGPVVHFRFNAEGADKFYDLTSKNPGRQLATILDGQVIIAPGISEPISGGSGEITGLKGDEVKEISMLLKSGSLVAPVTVEEDRQVGATLGAESIRKGLIACLVGLGLLFLFSLIYYKVSGLLAFLALIFNLVLVLFGLYSVRATLTLPGIAGMVLTIGMAVDASILIFERIKEALAAGVSVKKAVNSGFSNAMVVILDANITTFIVGVVLYQFGTGPLRGFAVTMMLGIVATLITGLIFLRSMFNFILNAFKVEKLSI